MLISIISASYNYARYIGAAIESVLAQSDSGWELIVADDGSADDSREIIAGYAARDPRIRLITHPDGKNHGLAATVQLALGQCAGEYVAFLESDDLWLPECLARRRAIAEKYHPAIIANDVELFGDEKRIREYDAYFRRRARRLRKFSRPRSIFRQLLGENDIPTFSGVMIRRDVLLKCSFENVYDPWLDRFLYLQAARQGDFCYLPEVLSRWRMHPESYITRQSAGDYRRCHNRHILQLLHCTFDNSDFSPMKRRFLIACCYAEALRLRLFASICYRLGRKYGIEG